MQVSVRMGDSRHKKSPPKWKPENNSKIFRDTAEAVLAGNRAKNALAGRQTPDDSGWLIESHADIARELSKRTERFVQQRIVDKILGAVREETKIKLLGRSSYIGQIRDMLGIEFVELIVPAERAEVLAALAQMPEPQFAVYRDSVRTTEPSVAAVAK